MSSSRIPVTVLTGFLGAGKTTLLNRILREHHGQRIAVIENEFGEIGIDQALVVHADEEVFEMNNGCICCTVRGDLIRVLGNLMRRRDKFDRILVETTGMANPGPVAQTFFVDDEIQADFQLDGIVTLVDAKHLDQHLGGSGEAFEQVAFADVIVINKTDLVDASALDALERRLRGINGMAKVLRAQHAALPIADVLDVGGFDLARAVAMRPTFLEPEYPIEWAGGFRLDAGEHVLTLAPGPDPTMRCILAPCSGLSADALTQAADRTLRLDRQRATPLEPGSRLPPDGAYHELQLATAAPSRFLLTMPVAGDVVLLTQHLPSEFAMTLTTAVGREVHADVERAFAAEHTHDDAVGSVGFEFDAPFDQRKLNAAISTLLRERGADIFRMKGVLAVKDSDRRWVFQGVHMLLDAAPDEPWGDRTPKSQLIFIGRGLDRADLRARLEGALA